MNEVLRNATVAEAPAGGPKRLALAWLAIPVAALGLAVWWLFSANPLAGFNNGAWNGTGGINSSAAATDANGLTALGYLDNAEPQATEFAGVSGLTGTEILVKFTYYGDADLSGDVTLDDFTQFLNGFQTQSAATNNWLNGDFDFSGTVTLDDFTQFLFGMQNQGGPL